MFSLNDLYSSRSVSLEVRSLPTPSLHALADYGRLLDAPLPRRAHAGENLHGRGLHVRTVPDPAKANQPSQHDIRRIQAQYYQNKQAKQTCQEIQDT